MGVNPKITAQSFPKQGRMLHMPVAVMFNYDDSAILPGRVIRDDAEEPFLTIIQIKDGPPIMGTECQYQPLPLNSAAQMAILTQGNGRSMSLQWRPNR